MMARHPDRNQLTEWLIGNNEDLDDHIDTCETCIDRIQALDGGTLGPNRGNVEPITADLRPALLALLEPPEDLHQRVGERIAQRLQDRSDANLFGALLGIPVEISKVLFKSKHAED